MLDLSRIEENLVSLYGFISFFLDFKSFILSNVLLFGP